MIMDDLEVLAVNLFGLQTFLVTFLTFPHLC